MKITLTEHKDKINDWYYSCNNSVCFRSTLEDGAILQRSLLLKNVTSEDLKSTFACVVTNAAGTAYKHTMLAATSSDCVVRKKRKHWMLPQQRLEFSEPCFTCKLTHIWHESTLSVNLLWTMKKKKSWMKECTKLWLHLVPHIITFS